MYKRISKWVIPGLFFAIGVSFGQTGPTFEVASIKKGEPLDIGAVMSGRMHIGMTIDNAMVNINSMSLSELLRFAYKLKSFQISGPEWLGAERFDIVAKMPAGASRDDIPAMMQALLADRFKLTFHRTTTDQSVYALVVVKPELLKESPPDAATDAPGGPASPHAATPADGGAQVRANVTSEGGVINSSSVNGNMKMVPGENGMHMEITKMNAAGMVEVLGRFTERPVVDMTSLQGKYDMTINVGLEDALKLARGAGMTVPSVRSDGTAADPGSSSVFNAIQQYGLKLEPRKAPIEMLIIDHVEKTPTEN